MGRNGNSLGTKLLSCVMSVVLAIGLMPLPAFAGEAEGAAALTAAEMGGIRTQAVQPAQDFMEAPEQLSKPSEVNGTNWMSAIPGERRITEINVPYSHDSATKDIDNISVLVDIDYVGDIVADILKDFGWEYAKTQLLTIPEQLNSGVRVLDVRMNNVGPDQSSVYWSGFEDDGKNLWVAHGRKATGTYYAKNANGTTVSVAQVLGYVKQFLTDHPTETITILFTVESQEYDKVHDKCFYRLRNHLQELADEKNPSTGKPYLYREEGHGFFDMYTHIPLLKDCRGQLVIEYDSDEGADGIIGGMYGMGGLGSHRLPDYDVVTMREPGNNSVVAKKKIKNLHLFMDDAENWHPISRSVTPHLKHFYFMSLATHTEGVMDYVMGDNKPLDMAKTINKEFFDEKDAFFKQNGIYFGWVKMDGIKKEYAERIWRSNFASDDYLDYCTVTVKSGLDGDPYPDQEYRVVKGTPITFPECIYDYDPAVEGKFDGWRVQEASGKEYIKQAGGTANADSDMTVTALWNKQVKDEVMVKLVPGSDDVTLPDGYELGADSTCLFKAPYDQKFGNLGLDQASRPGYELDGWYNSRGGKMEDTRRLNGGVFDLDNGQSATIEDENGLKYYLITLTPRWYKHQMRSPEYSWADDLSACTATRSCWQEGCTECIETETVNTTPTVVTAPSCTTRGQIIHTAEFENPAFTTQKKESYPKKLAHEWQDPVYEWSDNYRTVTATRSCALDRDGTHQEIEIVETTSAVTKEPTETEEGETTYTATFENEAFASQTKTVTNIPALEHEHAWGEPTYTWSDDGETVTARRVCSKDASHVEQETVLAMKQTTKEASCEEAGEYTRTAKFGNKAFETQTKVFVEPKLEHEVWRVSVNENVVMPTCTETGSHDAVFYCLVCGGELERTPVTTSALGHRWGEWTQTSEKGVEERVCKNDASHKETRVVELDPAVVTAAPEGLELKYSGEPQELAKAGKAKGGTMVYALGENGTDAPADEEFKTDLPTATDSSTYYVWYKARGDASHADSEPACVTSSITGVGFRTHSLLLDGRIGVKFYMDLSALTDEQRESCSVTFKVSGRGGFEDTVKFDPTDKNPQSGKLYGFTCYVTSIQMAETITARFNCEGYEGAGDITNEYSVARYAQWTEDNKAAYEALGDEGRAVLALVRALADYGHYAQPFLSAARGWKIGDDYAEMPAAAGFRDSGAPELSEADVAEAEAASAGYAIAWGSLEGSGVEKATFSLGLNAGTDIFLYFKMKEGESVSSAKVDGKEAVLEKRPDGRWRVTVPNISAHKLGAAHEVSVTTSKGAEISASVSALSYASALFVAEGYKNDEKARNAVASLYRYREAAAAYLEAIGRSA